MSTKPGQLQPISPYTSSQLLQLLTKASASYEENPTYAEGDLRRICELAEGDARLALRTAERAIQLHPNAPPGRIDAAAIDAARKEVAELRRRYVLEQLTEHHVLIYEVLRQRSPTSSTRVRQAYEAICRKRGLQPVARRTFTHYVSRLADAGLITKDRAGSWGNAQTLRLSRRLHPNG